MSSITYPIKCPKCGSRPMCSDNSRPGHYECDSFLMGNGVLIERIGCVERQRNQSLDALERALSYLEDLPFPEGHSACLNVREVLIRLRGSAL